MQVRPTVPKYTTDHADKRDVARATRLPNVPADKGARADLRGYSDTHLERRRHPIARLRHQVDRGARSEVLGDNREPVEGEHVGNRARENRRIASGARRGHEVSGGPALSCPASPIPRRHRARGGGGCARRHGVPYRSAAGLVELQEAGDWQAPTMPAHYARHQLAARGAVAKLRYQGGR